MIKISMTKPVTAPKTIVKLIITFSLILLTTACATYNGRYQQQHDSTPTRLPSANELQDAIPKIEEKSKGGNRDYIVRGKNYQVLSNAENFQQTGTASYYGNKFHGHLTSNGEIYNMYSMSAAHKSLPLPSYVKVTNVTNNKSVVVRVNDRGPFHDNRVIDLSYSAAYKLDMLKTGTAPVKITALTVKQATTNMVKSAPVTHHKIGATTSHNSTKAKSSYFIQVFATSNKNKAKNTANALTALYQLPVTWLAQNDIFRVQIGPLDNSKVTTLLLNDLKRNGYPQAFQRKNIH
jgi:peptidoglycan lytic transglycosylase